MDYNSVAVFTVGVLAADAAVRGSALLACADCGVTEPELTNLLPGCNHVVGGEVGAQSIDVLCPVRLLADIRREVHVGTGAVLGIVA